MDWVMISEYREIEGLLGSKLAALKLVLNNTGIAADGRQLEREIDGYPERFKTKRSKKTAAVVDGAFVDTETAEHPFVPSEIRIALDGLESLVKFNYRPDSPFRLVPHEGGLRLESEAIGLEADVSLLPRPAVRDAEIRGFPGDDYVQVIGADRIGILVYTGCENWFYGSQCRFCDSCASRPDERDAKPSLNALRLQFKGDADAWWGSVGSPFIEGIKQAYSLVLDDPAIGPHRHVHLMAGNMVNLGAEWRFALMVAEALAAVRPLHQVDSYLNLLPPADPDWLYRAKDIGFRKVIFNLEVFGQRAFRIVCPGKNELVPYREYLDRMDQAVEVFGPGNVYCGFVFGAQRGDDLQQGVRELADRGIVADYTSFTPKPGTPWHKRSRPSLMATADFVALLASLYREHGFRPMYCSLSLRSSVMNEAFPELCSFGPSVPDD
jgi:hypothetical protein